MSCRVGGCKVDCPLHCFSACSPPKDKSLVSEINKYADFVSTQAAVALQIKTLVAAVSMYYVVRTFNAESFHLKVALPKYILHSGSVGHDRASSKGNRSRHDII